MWRKALSLVSTVGAICEGCTPERSPTVRFVIPDGMTGVFVIRQDLSSPPIVKSNDYTWTVTVPETRVIRVPSLDIFSNWHDVVIANRSGVSMPVVAGGPTQITIHELYGFDYGLCALIGTQEDFARARREAAAETAEKCRALGKAGGHAH